MSEVYNAEIYKNENCPNGCLRLFWDGDEGFGQYDLVIESHSEEQFPPTDYELEITGDSEYVDDDNNKEFLKSLFYSLIEHIKIIR
jgi:hypothetical protein